MTVTNSSSCGPARDDQGCSRQLPIIKRRILAAGEMRETWRPPRRSFIATRAKFAAQTGKIDWVVGVEGDAAQDGGKAQ